MPAPEQRFEALGKTWRFTFGFFAICTLEEQYDEPFILILLRYLPELGMKDALDEERLRQARLTTRMTDLRKLLKAGLSDHHPDATDRQVCAIVDALGVDRIGAMLKTAIASSMGGAGGEATEDPPSRRPRRK